jgi:hypothetical protein
MKGFDFIESFTIVYLDYSLTNKDINSNHNKKLNDDNK